MNAGIQAGGLGIPVTAEQREVEALLARARDLLSSSNGAADRLDAIKTRLLGEGETGGQIEKLHQEPRSAELHELRDLLEKVGYRLDRIHTAIGRLESV